MTGFDLAAHMDHLRARVLQDALTTATADYWHHRAEQFEAARPHIDDYNGYAIPADLAEADQRCAETAKRCRWHATLVLTAAEHDPADPTTHACMDGGSTWLVAAVFDDIETGAA